MVRYCVICRSRSKTGEQRSFHRIPADMERRREWASRILNYIGKENIPRESVVCSDHFSSDDLIVKSGGQVYLKKSAVPEIPSSSQQVTVTTITDSSENPLQNLEEQHIIGDDVHPEVLLPPRKKVKYSSSESTITAESDDISSKPSEGIVSNVATDISDTSSRTISAVSPDNTISISSTSSGPKSMVSTSHQAVTLVARKKPCPKDMRIKSLLRINHRLQTRIDKLKTEFKVLEEKYLSIQNLENIIKARLPGVSGEIMNRIIHTTKKKYSPQLRAFALTLHFYSSKAYNYVREKFLDALPHPSTITKWFMSVDGTSGFSEDAMRTIENKVSELARQNQTPICNLVMDEISIMKQIEWTGKRMLGYVDIESNPKEQNSTEAKEALVFMLVAVNGQWKISVGYFFIAGLAGHEKAMLVHKLLEFLKNVGIVISSLTFDGAPANFTMAKVLGANFENPSNLKTSFTNPATEHEMLIFLDICHMLKLIRNALASLQVIEDGDGNLIKWEYFQMLVKIQTEEGLHAGTKIKKRHMEWFREKMKVKLSAQTLSNSVADAFAFLREDIKLESFKDSLATETFVRIFNNLFDIFNSQSRFAKYNFKRAFDENNADTFITYLHYCTNYIQGLKFNGNSILTLKRKTGFLGFLISIQSLERFYKKYVIEKKMLAYILTYKLSQDHLEIFFSAIRSKGGHSNNPTARQFENIYKRLLVRCEIKGSENANAVALDSTSILFVTSNITKSHNDDKDLRNSDSYLQASNEVDDLHFLNSSAWHLTPYVNDVVAYISGFVVKCLKKCVNCKYCINMLETHDSLSLLQTRKKYGKLTNASAWVVTICRTAEKSIKYFCSTQDFIKKNNILEILKNHSLRYMPSTIYEDFGNHLLDTDVFNGHAIQLTKLVLEKYLHIRIHHETSKLKDSHAKEKVRSILTKTILFKNQ